MFADQIVSNAQIFDRRIVVLTFNLNKKEPSH